MADTASTTVPPIRRRSKRSKQSNQKNLAPTAAPAEPTQEDFMKSLETILAGEKASATFACGGKILTKVGAENKSAVDDVSLLPDSPVVFYETEAGESHKITFPPTPEEMEKLFLECDPASFGVGTKEHLDIDYRSAWKLDKTKFATNFHPSESDVMDIIKQFLLSGAVKFEESDPVISAELYKLNIYKGPNDQFKPHVDTPRSESQFGSLVICLPSQHTGGELVIRHDGHEVKFNWNDDFKVVQWAAFYSDCEHEVLPVTDGYRVTITYNLYYNKFGNQIVASPNWAGPFPLSEELAKVLQSKRFMPDGGILGIFCHHSYAHASNSPDYRLQRMLKGADAAVEAAALRFGLQVEIRPVYLPDANDQYDDDDDGKDPKKKEYKKRKLDPLGLFNTKATSTRHLDRGRSKWVGNEFLEFSEWRNYDYEEWLPDQLMKEDWVDAYSGIHWLNKPQYKEANLAYTAYGNEPSVGMLYSAAAMFIWVPKWDESRGRSEAE